LALFGGYPASGGCEAAAASASAGEALHTVSTTSTFSNTTVEPWEFAKKSIPKLLLFLQVV
jgi:hypothetical protein